QDSDIDTCSNDLKEFESPNQYNDDKENFKRKEKLIEKKDTIIQLKNYLRKN
ncbi:1341_t:CDS:1, partial [Racocetra fulgida]